MKNIRKRKIIILVVLLILIMVSWLIWGNLSVETNKLTVTSKDLPERRGSVRKHLCERIGVV